MTVRVMIDCETMGLRPGCAILSIGATTFGPGAKPMRFAQNIDLLSCLLVGLRVDEETQKWWMEQSLEAREALSSKTKVGLAFALECLTIYWNDVKAEEIWANGPMADVAWLEAAYEAVGQKAPWTYRQVRDYRTLWTLIGEPLGERVRPAVAHDALEDAVAQAADMERCLKELAALRDRPIS